MASFINPMCISAYVICLTSEGPRYLIIRRCCGGYLNGSWQMVTGGIAKGETASQAAYREIQEETGLIPSSLYSADAVETFYLHHQNKVIFAPVFVAFVKTMNVQLSAEEHDAYEWLSFEEARKRLIWAEQQRTIVAVHKRFGLKKPEDLLLIDIAYTHPSDSTLNLRQTGIALRDKKLLLIKQTKGPHSGKFDLPGGGIEDQETVEEALRREFREEVGMAFQSMQWMENLTASTEGLNEDQTPYTLHQVGLIYSVNNLLQIPNQVAEMESFWIDLGQLSEMAISPFVRQMMPLLSRIQKNSDGGEA